MSNLEIDMYSKVHSERIRKSDHFFFKQKTAYEIGVRLVGSEMCIRDSHMAVENINTG